MTAQGHISLGWQNIKIASSRLTWHETSLSLAFYARRLLDVVVFYFSSFMLFDNYSCASFLWFVQWWISLVTIWLDTKSKNFNNNCSFWLDSLEDLKGNPMRIWSFPAVVLLTWIHLPWISHLPNNVWIFLLFLKSSIDLFHCDANWVRV